MAIILFFTVIGFLTGLAYVMAKRKIKPGRILSAAFLGLAATGIWKILRTQNKRRRF